MLHKAAERIHLWHIESHYLNINPLHSGQHAFRPIKSVDSALADAIDFLQSATLRGEEALVIALDIRGAFDTLRHAPALEAIAKRGLPRDFLNWYTSYMTNRVATANLHGTDIRRILKVGVAQGGVFSPTLWNIPFDDLLKLVNVAGRKGIGYADDLLAILRGLCRQTLFELTREYLLEISEWSAKYGLKFCPDKTVAMFFTQKRITKEERENLPPLFLEGRQIKMVRDTKYLGIILDDKLTFSKHILNQVNKAKMKLTILKNQLVAQYGPQPKMLRETYMTCILPILTYGCHVWAHKASSNEYLFNSVTRLVAYIIAPYLPNTPTRGLEVMLRLPPILLRIEEEALLKHFRCRKQ